MYASDERFLTTPAAAGDAGVPLGFVFGPRALHRFTGRPIAVAVATGVGTQQFETRRFATGRDIAGFLVREWNRSLERAGVPACLHMAAVATLDRDEDRPVGASPDGLLDDIFHGRIGTLPVECWATRAAVASVMMLVDWGLDRAALERGAWTGRTPWPARAGPQGGIEFAPIAIADLHCALTAHTAAHEFGHLVGCTHEDVLNTLDPGARAYVANVKRFGVMATARADESGRRLEWSRPTGSGQPWEFGDADHDEGRWLRIALPELARQRFSCRGTCGGICPR